MSVVAMRRRRFEPEPDNRFRRGDLQVGRPIEYRGWGEGRRPDRYRIVAVTERFKWKVAAGKVPVGQPAFVRLRHEASGEVRERNATYLAMSAAWYVIRS